MRRVRIDLPGHCEFRENADGSVTVRFGALSMEATAPTEEDAFRTLVEELNERLPTDESLRDAWVAFVSEFGVEEDEPEEEPDGDGLVERSHAASAGFEQLTDASLDEAIGSSTPVLVDFWAEWCMPCHMLAPAIKEASDRLGARMRVAKLNVDENPETPDKFGIRGIPTLILFSQGRELHRIVGAGRSSGDLVAELEPHLV